MYVWFYSYVAIIFTELTMSGAPELTTNIFVATEYEKMKLVGSNRVAMQGMFDSLGVITDAII